MSETFIIIFKETKPQFTAACYYDEEGEKIINCASILRKDLKHLNLQQAKIWASNKGYKYVSSYK